jgi:cytochrome c oxidase assembly protein subunit 11
MPVTFYIDPEILDDKEIDYLDTITLSYTFYEKEVE